LKLDEREILGVGEVARHGSLNLDGDP